MAFLVFKAFRLFDHFRTPVGGDGGGPPVETYYIRVGGDRVVAGTDVITVGAP